MAKKKHYAVRVGRKPGIYPSWGSCKRQVDGVRGAQFKSFRSFSEAEAYMAGKADIKARDRHVKAKNNVARTDGAVWTYSGSTPPWEFPGDYIACVVRQSELSPQLTDAGQAELELSYEARLAQ